MSAPAEKKHFTWTIEEAKEFGPIAVRDGFHLKRWNSAEEAVDFGFFPSKSAAEERLRVIVFFEKKEKTFDAYDADGVLLKILAKKFHKVYHVDRGTAAGAARGSAKLALLQPKQVRQVLGILQRRADERRGIKTKGRDYS